MFVFMFGFGVRGINSGEVTAQFGFGVRGSLWERVTPLGKCSGSGSGFGSGGGLK